MGKLSVSRVRGKDVKELAKNTRRAFTGLTTQANSGSGFYGVLGDAMPTGLKGGDTIFRLNGSSFEISMADDRGQLFTIPLTLGGSDGGGMALTQSATAPTTTHLPNAGDSGWHLNTSTNDLYIAINIGGSVRRPTLSTFSGTISASQHGNMAGGNLHAVATTSAAGFMSAADKTRINDIFGTVAASNALNATQYSVNGVRVIRNRLPVVASVVGTAGATYTATEQGIINSLVTSVNDLLDRLRATTGHGLIGG